jgi:hypothetical protein
MYFYGCMSTALVRKILALGSNDHASKSLSLGRNKLVFGRNILSSGSKICSKVLLLSKAAAFATSKAMPTTKTPKPYSAKTTMTANGAQALLLSATAKAVAALC